MWCKVHIGVGISTDSESRLDQQDGRDAKSVSIVMDDEEKYKNGTNHQRKRQGLGWYRLPDQRSKYGRLRVKDKG
jgi:hypothetical protein